MAQKINIAILQKGRLETGINKVIEYQKNLQLKCERFVKELAEQGIQVAWSNSGTAFIGDVIFWYDIKESNPLGVKCIMWGRNTHSVFGEGGEEISPILFLEYGSGLNAHGHPSKIKAEVPVGRGTFPGQKHANDPNGWYYQDENGEWHHSFGYSPRIKQPHAPMQKAFDEISLKQKEIARRIFC